MGRQENEQYVKSVFFDGVRRRRSRLISQFVSDAQIVLEEAASVFDYMLPDMAYVDKRDHPLAPGFFEICADLSVYLSLRERGVSAHDFGRAMLTSLAQSSVTPENLGSDPEALAEFIARGESSRTDPAPGEVVFEAFAGNRDDYDWGINFTSCATCNTFSKYGAMDLAPYICAKADILSDIGNQGLRRTGTIALGAQQCEYRYKNGGEPLGLATQYPDQIRYVEKR